MSTASVQIAKDRLKALLGADRMQCTPDITRKTIRRSLSYPFQIYGDQPGTF